MRNDIGNGKNVFGFNLKDEVSKNSDINLNTTWKNLTDDECQQIRDMFSIYKDKSGRLNLLDKLSNEYLGTKGSSFGSWDKNKGCYTGGIFMNAKTSCNHEIWERIIQITKLFYKELYNADFEFKTWSWPGDPHSPFKFEKDGKFYYDDKCTKLYNYLAPFTSSVYINDGKYKERSWLQVLREYGYLTTHDFIYPSRCDGVDKVMMSKQFIYNCNFGLGLAKCWI
ncbi:MAG: hypothetical protein P1P64_05330 [Treponemataceae bacterium]